MDLRHDKLSYMAITNQIDMIYLSLSLVGMALEPIYTESKTAMEQRTYWRCILENGRFRKVRWVMMGDGQSILINKSMAIISKLS